MDLLQRATAMFALLLWPLAAAAVPIRIEYVDPPGAGFFDPVLGSARREALQVAVDFWAMTLDGNIPIIVEADMPEMGGLGDSALLASSGPTTLQRNFPRAPHQNTFFPVALANQLSGNDLNDRDISEIRISFNASVDNATVLGSVDWYYGLDAQPGADVDFISIALHELGHGLGFGQLVNSDDGSLLQDTPTAFDMQIFRPGVGGFASMRDAERLAAITSEQLFWIGPAATAAHGASPPLYAPNPFRGGSSISHWDTRLSELMAPFFVGAVRDPGLLLPALEDIGWGLVTAATPLPSVPPTATPTATAVPVASATATPWTQPPRRLVYVSNYDDSTLTVIDAAARRTIATVPVGAGPLGVTATAAGRLVVTANFQDHSLSLLATATGRVVGNIDLPGAPNALAIAADGQSAWVSLTDIDSVAAVDLTTRSVNTLIRVGRSPSGLALTADGSGVVVAHFNETTLGLIDTATLVFRAKARGTDMARGLSAISMPANGGNGFVTAFHSKRFWEVGRLGFAIFSPRQVHPDLDLVPEAVVFSPDGAIAYFAAFRRADGFGWVVKIDTDTGEARVFEMIGVGSVPEALAISADGLQLYVANTGSDTVSIVEPERTCVVATIPVGAAPMGITVVEVPRICGGDCDGDATTTVDELITGINIALGLVAPESCQAIDTDVSGDVSVDEIVAAVGLSLGGCP